MIRRLLVRWLAGLLADAGHETRHIARPKPKHAHQQTHAALLAKLGPRQRKRRRLTL